MVSLSIFITGNCHSIVKRIPYQRGSNPEKTFREENRNSDTRVFCILGKKRLADFCIKGYQDFVLYKKLMPLRFLC